MVIMILREHQNLTLTLGKNMLEELRWKKYPVLNDGFICLVDVMGDDQAIVQAARISYGKDEYNDLELKAASKILDKEVTRYHYNFSKAMNEQGPYHIAVYSTKNDPRDLILLEFAADNTNKIKHISDLTTKLYNDQQAKDRSLIRRLMKDQHTSPFEMVELKFKIRVPMDCWRQWIRHRTASVNEYSTRYSEAIDSQQTTLPEEWRLQAKDNKQGSSGFLEEWPALCTFKDPLRTPGQVLSDLEEALINNASTVYEARLALGIAREQARKDLPLSTYTEAYWKCDLHNIFNFLRLRLDSHAQLEIRLYAQAMYEIVKQVCPIACEAFEDYVLNTKKFSAMEMELLKNHDGYIVDINDKPNNMTDNEWKSFLEKLI